MTGIIILAAGASSRMGKPKQDLIYEGETLLQRTMHVAEAAASITTVVVLGANAEKINIEIKSKRLCVCHNIYWPEGMSSSIRIGLQQLLNLHPAAENAIYILCDQPFITAKLLHKLMQTQQEKQAGIVACAYQGTYGAPVLFNKKYFNELLALTGQEGAKKLLMKFSDDVVTVPFEQGAIDIDTPEDYKRLNSPAS
jgi:molybdenum cofactor cytidylyltransferase